MELSPRCITFLRRRGSLAAGHQPCRVALMPARVSWETTTQAG